MTYHLNLKETDKLAFVGYKEIDKVLVVCDDKPDRNFWYFTKDGKKLSAQDIADVLKTTKWNNAFDDDGYISSDADARSIDNELKQL